MDFDSEFAKLTNTLKKNAVDSEVEDFQKDMPYIKISKNTKGYNFDFKILDLNQEELERVHNLIVSKIKEWEQKK